MNTFTNTLRRGFTVTPNAVIQNPDLTPQARWLYGYIASMADDWQFFHDPIMKNARWSDETLSKYLKELMDFGLITREERRVNGMFNGWDYTIHAEPATVPGFFRGGKKPGRKKSEVINTNDNKPLYTRTREIEWSTDHEVRAAQALKALQAYLKDNPGRWRQLADDARSELTSKDFVAELKLWVGHNNHDGGYEIMTSPVKALTSGPGNFTMWLSRDFCRAKYKKEPQPGAAAELKYSPPEKR